MASFISDFILVVRIHVFKNKAINHQLDTYWVTEELFAHGRYSPFILEIQKNQDLKTYFWPLGIVATLVLVVGLILCSSSHWTIQWTGIAVCMLATYLIINVGTTLWRCHNTGVLSNKEAV